MAGGMQGGFPVQPVPVQKPGNSRVWLWSLVGCGVIALLVVVIGGILLTKFLNGSSILGVGDAMKTASTNFSKVSDAVESYQKDNSGKYPPNLDALIPKYLADKSTLTSGGATPHPMVYTVPKADADGETVVMRVYVWEVSVPPQKQKIYLVLLKNGAIEQESVARINLSKAKLPAGQSGSQ